jgi:hypothetical protein
MVDHGSQQLLAVLQWRGPLLQVVLVNRAQGQRALCLPV